MISKNQIRQIQALHQKKFRDNQKLFLAEGVKMVKEIVESNHTIIQELFATADFIFEHENILKSSGIKYNEISDKELEQISSLASPNKVLAVCNYFGETKTEVDFKKFFSLYLDDIRDPGNFGTIIRLADWYGIGTIFCSPTSCDLYNPKVIQSTMGAFLRVKVAYLPLEKIITDNNVGLIYGAVLKGKNIYAERLTNGLIVIGNEANGISKENLALVNHPITIPSHSANGTESLNAAMATGIIVSEFFRQQHY
ncbi:MAG: RNA methyltransferase [Bacteroidetes bacterium]|nr:RNA methyltransferase [Bacteroidota bacterium]